MNASSEPKAGPAISIPCCDPGLPVAYSPQGTFSTLCYDECGSSVACYHVGSGSELLIIWSDVFGISFGKSPEVADQLAQAGYRVFVPDLFDGRPYSTPPGVRWSEELFHEFLVRCPVSNALVLANRITQSLSESNGNKRIHVVGVCYGAKIVVGQLQSEYYTLIRSGTLAHPTFVDEHDAKTTNNSVPMFLLLAQFDIRFSDATRDTFLSTLVARGAPHHCVVYPDVHHGFFTRPRCERDNVEQQKSVKDLIVFLENNNKL